MKNFDLSSCSLLEIPPLDEIARRNAEFLLSVDGLEAEEIAASRLLHRRERSHRVRLAAARLQHEDGGRALGEEGRRARSQRGGALEVVVVLLAPSAAAGHVEVTRVFLQSEAFESDVLQAFPGDGFRVDTAE